MGKGVAPQLWTLCYRSCMAIFGIFFDNNVCNGKRSTYLKVFFKTSSKSWIIKLLVNSRPPPPHLPVNHESRVHRQSHGSVLLPLRFQYKAQRYILCAHHMTPNRAQGVLSWGERGMRTLGQPPFPDFGTSLIMGDFFSFFSKIDK